MSFMMQTTFQTNCGAVFSTGTFANFKSFNFIFCPTFFLVESNGVQANVYSVLNDGYWHSIIITYDGTTLSFYKDGIFLQSLTSWNVGSSSTLSSTVNTVGNGNYLGRRSDWSYKWSGSLKYVKFNDYVTTST